MLYIATRVDLTSAHVTCSPHIVVRTHLMRRATQQVVVNIISNGPLSSVDIGREAHLGVCLAGT